MFGRKNNLKEVYGTNLSANWCDRVQEEGNPGGGGGEGECSRKKIARMTNCQQGCGLPGEEGCWVTCHKGSPSWGHSESGRTSKTVPIRLTRTGGKRGLKGTGELLVTGTHITAGLGQHDPL